MPPLKPRFPPNLEHDLLPCPPIGRRSSTFTKTANFYIHRWILLPISQWYCRSLGVSPLLGFLPFGFVIKRGSRVSEQEGLAMDLARAMGIPAPRFISYGEPPKNYKDPWAVPTLLMTRLSGTPMDMLDKDDIDLDVVKDDLMRILIKMRRYASPFGDAVCGVDGGPVRGPLVPSSPLPACANEAAFQQVIREIGAFTNTYSNVGKSLVAVERCFALPPHAIVFTHGDLNDHNIMLGDDGHVSGIFDWEAAAWMPEYWEISVTAFFPGRPWGRFMHEKVTGGVYAEEVEGHGAIFRLTSDSFSY